MGGFLLVALLSNKIRYPQKMKGSLLLDVMWV